MEIFWRSTGAHTTNKIGVQTYTQFYVSNLFLGTDPIGKQRKITSLKPIFRCFFALAKCAMNQFIEVATKRTKKKSEILTGNIKKRHKLFTNGKH